MIKITKTNTQPYNIAGTSIPQTEIYTISYDDGRQLKGRLWYEKKSDSLMVAFRDENNNDRSPRKSAIDNEIALNGFYEVKPQGEKSSQNRQKTSKVNNENIITESDIEKYLTEDEVKDYKELLDTQKVIFEKLANYNNIIKEKKEDEVLRILLRDTLEKYGIDKVKDIVKGL